MANRTVKDASSVHGTNPQYLIEKIIRTRIYDSKFWKEECFALTAELLVDKAMALRYIGGVYGGNIKPAPFLCLALKMLQIQPEKDIVIEFIKQDEFKYMRALGSFYLRLVHSSLDCYKYLEPLLNDYRKLRIMDRNGVFHLSYMDQFIDTLLTEDRYCDVILPRIQKRWVHEANNELDPRLSLMEDNLDDLESESDDEDDALPPSPPLNTSPKHRSERSGRHCSPSRDRRRHLSPSPSGDHKRHRDRDNRDHRHRDSGRMRDRNTGDYYGSNYSQESSSYHDYHHGSMNNSSTDYHHRRGHHSSSHHYSSSMSEQQQHHRSSRDYHRNNDDHHHHSSSRGDDHRRREHRTRDEGSSRRDKKESSRRKDRSDRKGSSSLQGQIDEANALRAQLGLPPLK